jgi:hypothetical protein
MDVLACKQPPNTEGGVHLAKDGNDLAGEWMRMALTIEEKQ